jgi:DNA-binding MarR family transcriptional regulator
MPFRRDITSFRTRFMNLSRRLRREAASDDRCWSRLQLLGAIERAGGEATPTMLGESESMRSSNLAAALRDLETDGLIARTQDAEDRRKVRVRLTRTGHEVLYDNIARRERWLAKAIVQSLTKEERALLFKAGKLLDRVAGY